MVVPVMPVLVALAELVPGVATAVHGMSSQIRRGVLLGQTAPAVVAVMVVATAQLSPEQVETPTVVAVGRVLVTLELPDFSHQMAPVIAVPAVMLAAVLAEIFFITPGRQGRRVVVVSPAQGAGVAAEQNGNPRRATAFLAVAVAVVVEVITLAAQIPATQET